MSEAVTLQRLVKCRVIRPYPDANSSTREEELHELYELFCIGFATTKINLNPFFYAVLPNEVSEHVIFWIKNTRDIVLRRNLLPDYRDFAPDQPVFEGCEVVVAPRELLLNYSDLSTNRAQLIAVSGKFIN